MFVTSDGRRIPHPLRFLLGSRVHFLLFLVAKLIRNSANAICYVLPMWGESSEGPI